MKIIFACCDFEIIMVDSESGFFKTYFALSGTFWWERASVSLGTGKLQHKKNPELEHKKNKFESQPNCIYSN